MSFLEDLRALLKSILHYEPLVGIWELLLYFGLLLAYSNYLFYILVNFDLDLCLPRGIEE